MFDLINYFSKQLRRPNEIMKIIIIYDIRKRYEILRSRLHGSIVGRTTMAVRRSRKQI